MIKRRAAALLSTALLAALLSGAPAGAGGETDEARAGRISDAILTSLVESNGVPGMGAAVWRDGRIAWSGSAGFRDIDAGEPVTNETVFRFASVSKLFAATAAARLREQGRLDVDAPVGSIVPYLSTKWAPLTTAQLASHTAGIPHYQEVDVDRGGRRFGSVREAVGVFGDRDLLSQPGARYRYSSWGYVLLSAVIEAAAGETYLEHIAREISPGLAIGPDRTGTADPAVTVAYEFVDGDVRKAADHDYSYTWAGGGFRGTAPALAEFGGRVISGHLVSRETLDWMLVPAGLTDGSAAAEREFPVGFGWRGGRDADGRALAHHAGVTLGARSALVGYPDHALAVSLLSNASWTSSIEQSAQMIAAPFLPADRTAKAWPCPTNTIAYEARFDDVRSEGEARFTLVDGLCIGQIASPRAVADFVDGFPQRDAASLTIVGVDLRGGLSRGALVTPIGVFDLRVQTDGGYLARFSDTRALVLRLLD